jgi:hypothetical protein
MAKAKGSTIAAHTSVSKRTKQGSGKVKTSSMNKTERKTFKKYRGQGK